VKQSVIVASTMEAEFVAWFEAQFRLTSYGILFGLGVVDSIAKPLKIYCDNSTIVFSS